MRASPFLLIPAVLFAITLFARAEDNVNEQLLEAARTGNLQLVQQMLEKGADVNARNRYGTTPLFFAAAKGHLDILRLLLDKGADPNVEDTFYHATPLIWSITEGRPEVVKLLLEKGAKGSDEALIFAASDSKTKDTVQVILETTKQSPETLSKALTAAEDAKATEISELLKKAGAKVMPSQSVQVDPEILKKYAGSFRREDGNELKLKVEGNVLIAEPMSSDPFPLQAIDDHTFTPSSGGLTMQFDPASPSADSFTVKRDDGSSSVYKRINPEAAAPVVTLPATLTTPLTPGASIAKTGWPSFRGVHASGIGDGLNPPIRWNAADSTNIAWKTAIPGLSNSSPVVWENRVFVTTAISSDPAATLRTGLYGEVEPATDVSKHTWKLYCLDRKSGKILWEQTVSEGVPQIKRHPKSTQANSTPATDGKHVIALFSTGDLVAFDLNGKKLWQINLGTLDSGWFYDPDYQWGYGSSPVIYKNLVIVQADLQTNSAIIAFDVNSGKKSWSTARNEIPSWGTPTVIESKSRVELVTNGTNAIRGYDPLTGKELWQLKGNSEITVPTPLFAHNLIYVTSGYAPIQPIYAIRPGGNGDISLKEGTDTGEFVVWSKKRGGPYLPTPIVYGDYLFTCANNGIVTVYNAKTGEKIQQQRLGGKRNAFAFTASPVAADGRLYFSSEDGEIFVVRAAPPFDILATNSMGEVIMATPAISDKMLIVRAQGHIYGIAEPGK